MFDDFGVPPAALDLFAQNFQRLLVGEGIAVNAFDAQRVVNIAGAQNADGERDFVAAQSVGIARTVELGVMRTDERQGFGQRLRWDGKSVRR